MRRLSLVVVLLTLAVLKGGAQAPAQQPPATRSAAPGSAACRSAGQAHLPGRRRLRPRRRHRHQQEGRTDRRSQARRGRGLRGRPTSGRGVVQAVQGRRDLPRPLRRGRSVAFSTRSPRRSGRTFGCLRSSSTTITFGAATPCAPESTWPTSSVAPSRRRTWWASCTRSRRPPTWSWAAITRRWPVPSSSSTAASTTMSRGTSSRSGTRTTRRASSSRSATTSRLGRSRG